MGTNTRRASPSDLDTENVREVSTDVAPEFFTLAVDLGCCMDTDEDLLEVVDEVRAVTASAARHGLSPDQRVAAADYFRAAVMEHVGDSDPWSALHDVVELVARTPWRRTPGTEAHFKRLELAGVDDDLAMYDGCSADRLDETHEQRRERVRLMIVRMRARRAVRRAELIAELREHAWTEALSSRQATTRRPTSRLRSHAGCARRRGAGRPRASSARSRSSLGDSPSGQSEPPLAVVHEGVAR